MTCTLKPLDVLLEERELSLKRLKTLFLRTQLYGLGVVLTLLRCVLARLPFLIAFIALRFLKQRFMLIDLLG